ncbi:hypothetical protein Ocin01_15903, partial [Orchesella cincta]
GGVCAAPQKYIGSAHAGAPWKNHKEYVLIHKSDRIIGYLVCCDLRSIMVGISVYGEFVKLVVEIRLRWSNQEVFKSPRKSPF